MEFLGNQWVTGDKSKHRLKTIKNRIEKKPPLKKTCLRTKLITYLAPGKIATVSQGHAPGKKIGKI